MMFTRIEEIHIGDHYYLDDNDECFFYGEYTAGGGYAYSEINQLISNLKKSMDKQGRYEWKYKINAIRDSARIISRGINPDWLRERTLVPVPPSRIKTDPLYDDRMVQILRMISPPANYDIRELVIQTVPRDPMHTRDTRYTPEELEGMYEIDQDLIAPRPNGFAIFDDMLTSGTHFKAIKSLLDRQFPGSPVTGIFIARRAIDHSAMF